MANKILEINVLSPGGLDSASKYEGVNFFHEIIKALENKVDYIEQHPKHFDNNRLATLHSP